MSPLAEPDYQALSARTGLSEAALRVLYEALQRGRGAQAQFNHPELGGMGQWMWGGMIMIGDMFNSALSAKVAHACSLLADAAAAVPAPVFLAMESDRWWPAELGDPSSSAVQNGFAYALFPVAGRLAVRTEDGRIAVYDISGMAVHGVGAQSGTLVVQTASGPRSLESLRRL